MAFDTRVHIRDPKSGEITRKQPYRLNCDKALGSWYERDGMRYAADGTVLGPVGDTSGSKLIQAEVKTQAPMIAQSAVVETKAMQAQPVSQGGAAKSGVQTDVPSSQEARK